MPRPPVQAQMKDLERSNVPGVRKVLSALGAVVAEVDRQLRYVWIDNPHPDFDPEAAVGKRDDELVSTADAEEIMALKQDTFTRQAPISRILSFKRTGGLRYYSLFTYPIRDSSGKVEAVLTVGFDVPAPADGGK
jgi:hypothetical protein